MKNIKILIAAIVVIILFGGFAFAKSIPTASERLITQHENLIEQRKSDWSKLDIKQKIWEDEVDKIIEQKLQIEREANMFRETISVLNGDPVGVDTTEDFQ